MKAAIITFPGSNCDYDCYKAITDVLGEEARFVWHREDKVGECDLVVLPGGFSYGDYLRAGAIARFSPIMADVQRFAADGGYVLGVCNGFQVLCEAHMLPGALVKNRSLKFQGERVWCRVENAGTAFTNRYDQGQVLHLHIAHGQGNYVADPDVIDELESSNRVVFRYVDDEGNPSDEGNANGSVNNIAGIINEHGNVLGLMPHPERSVELLLGSADGLPLFESIAEAIGSRSGGGAVAGTASSPGRSS
ncbi:MAG TPA: phosphoribosylformylglycinamidine synthase subunit PurQ [Longimicrobiales bacterium]|nr:phosphoribosylformylglycinamidine synthase subunit PurQ [Longimicrobiales bacterium]